MKADPRDIRIRHLEALMTQLAQRTADLLNALPPSTFRSQKADTAFQALITALQVARISLARRWPEAG